MDQKRFRGAAAAIGMLAVIVTPAVAWQAGLTGITNTYQFAFSLALDGVGNVVAGGLTNYPAFPTDPDTSRFTVAKFGSTGGVLWRYQGVQGVGAESVALDPNGNVLAASFHDLAKIDGTTGTQLWHSSGGLRNNYEDDSLARIIVGNHAGLAVDAQGDVITTGRVVGRAHRVALGMRQTDARWPGDSSPVRAAGWRPCCGSRGRSSRPLQRLLAASDEAGRQPWTDL